VSLQYIFIPFFSLSMLIGNQVIPCISGAFPNIKIKTVHEVRELMAILSDFIATTGWLMLEFDPLW
jgi:hypothetical protein